jgi:16S rRNA (adenine1518-N6/adenine1519-N6)-dimethyltransferase
VRPRRRFGQHFLTDPRLLGRIADALDAGPGSTVLEIGPGPGGLTTALLARAGRVVAVEKDRDLARALRERLPNLELVEGDALDLDWHQLAGANAIVAGNIPYNITTPLIDKALAPPGFARVVFLVQKEVALRITADPGTRAYGALTVGVQAVARAERLFTIPAGAFLPPPKVDSALLRLDRLPQPLIRPGDTGPFRRLVTGLFSYRRKQLSRGLREFTGWPPLPIAAVLSQASLPPAARPESLAPSDFGRLHTALVDAGWAPSADL